MKLEYRLFTHCRNIDSEMPNYGETAYLSAPYTLDHRRSGTMLFKAALVVIDRTHIHHLGHLDLSLQDPFCLASTDDVQERSHNKGVLC